MNSAPKKICRSVKIGIIAALFVVVLSANRAEASLWSSNSLTLASIFDVASSFLGKVVSSFSETLNTLPLSAPGSSSLVNANCIPPVPPKPAGFDVSAKYGSITVTPEASTAGPNNIVTISVTPNLDILHNLSINVPTRISKSDLIDWNPKQQPGIIFDQQTFDSSEGYSKLLNSAYGWGVGKDQKTLPTTQTYWIKIRLRNATIPERAKNAVVNSLGWNENHGWKKIHYDISNISITGSRGFHGIYVGREQKPSLVTTIPNYDPKYQTFYGKFLNQFTVAPNGYFEIQTKSLGQPGTITVVLKNGKVVGDTKRVVQADETITWKIQPLTVAPVLLKELSLVNTCGEDYFVDPARSAKFSDLDQFKFPVKYDFDALTTQSVDLVLGIRGTNLTLTTLNQSIHLKAELSTKGETKVPVPNIPITFRAVYADNQKETVKNATFKTYASEEENMGEITERTIQYGESVAMGSALVSISGQKLTAADLKRGIIIKAVSERFPRLSAEMTIPISVPKQAEPQPKSPTPTPKPTPTEQSKKISPQSLTVSPNRALEGLKEGDKIVFTAKLVMSDGSVQILKDKVEWTLVGKIGSISSLGIFGAKLDDSIAEYGEGSGAVVATYKDADGKTFVGKSAIFKVEAAVPENATPPDG